MKTDGCFFGTSSGESEDKNLQEDVEILDQEEESPKTKSLNFGSEGDGSTSAQSLKDGYNSPTDLSNDDSGGLSEISNEGAYFSNKLIY